MIEERWPLPSSWRWYKVCEIAQIVGGGTPAANDESNFDDAGIPWVTPADLTGYEDAYIARGRRSLSEKGLATSSARILPPRTVLYSSRAPIGYCAIAADSISTNQGFKSLVLHEGSVPEFIRYYLLASKEYAESLASGTTFKELSGARMGEMLVPLPPLNEQRRIVAKLDSLVAYSRRVREELASIPHLVERYRQAVLAAAFDGSLTAEWRQINPLSTAGSEIFALFLDAHRQNQQRGVSKKRDLSNLAEPGLLPSSWAWIPVELLASKVTDGVHKKPHYVQAGIPFLTVRNLTAGPGLSFDGCRFVTPADHAEFIKRTHPERGDILISKDGTLGVVRAIRTDEIFSIFVSLALVKPIDRTMTDYLELAFSSPSVQAQMVGVGTGLQHIHLIDLRQDLIPVAPPEERLVIVQRVHRLFEAIDKMAAEAARATALLNRLDQATLAKAFRGELVAQDPNELPVSIEPRIVPAPTRARPDRTPSTAKKVKTGRTAKTREGSAMAKKRTDVSETHLTEALRELGGAADASALWQRSGMDIDEFYKQLRGEMKAGRIEEGSSKERLKLTDAA